MPAQDKLLMEKLRLARDGSPGTATPSRAIPPDLSVA
jgi:hypothetical protein